MAKTADRYVCQSCGAVYAKWTGRCEACSEWNSVVETVPRDSAPRGLGRRRGKVVELADLPGLEDTAPRRPAGIAELDRVLGGGLVAGSAVLIGGDPGIGKSTLLLQAAAAMAEAGAQVVYVSGEEAPAQIQMRAARLGLGAAPIKLAAETNVRDILTTLEGGAPVDVVVIDSIQTMFVDVLESAPGTVAQVRASAQELIRFAKRRGAALFLVGHVTKDGQIAGPRVLEHMVDTVLYFEGERGHQYRILRSVKNRFGGTEEIGVFEMTDAGLRQVANPSSLFLGERRTPVSGAAVFAGIEGSRPVLVEIQALVAPSPLATPRRAVVGWDGARLAMILAVLERRAGLALAAREVYLNVAGGLRIVEPAADLAAAAALISSAGDVAVPDKSVFFGEIGLSGEVRPVSKPGARLREAAKLGFARAFAPQAAAAGSDGIEVTVIDSVAGLADLLMAGADH